MAMRPRPERPSGLPSTGDAFSTYRPGMGTRASHEATQLALQKRNHKQHQHQRMADAVRMKDEQLRVLREQNQTLLQAVNEGEEDKIQLGDRLSEVESASLVVQNENLELQRKTRVAIEDGRLEVRKTRT